MGAQCPEQHGLGDPHMLAKIDKLFGCGVGELVDLPQIVVVGDQSSGKSSVLEGLIKKALPRDSGLCTRFATQIVFRRALEEHISVSIIPDAASDADHRATAKSWGRNDVSSLDAETFTSIMREVHEIMGVSSPGDITSEKRTFSRDVLRMEISGPEQEHLSVIDVPGIFKNTTPGVTTKNDMALVRDIVTGYMENPRSVMLTVIPANVDVATQEILELAADVDPNGDRTLGVLTKPDLVDRGAEMKVVDLIEGRTRKTKLGWHVVRNPGQQQLTETSEISLDRSALEFEFFSSVAPWKAIDADKKGIESLRDRLKEVLSSLVKQEFPKVKNEIGKRLTEANRSFKALGPERSTSAAQASYLTDLATRYSQLAMLSLQAKFGSDELFDDLPSLRIAPSVVARAMVFETDMARYGHTYIFSGGSTEKLSVHGTPEASKKKAVAIPTNDELSLSSQGDSFEVRKEHDDFDVTEILQPQETLKKPNDRDIEPWLRTVYETSRGFELGAFDASILATTMKKQSSKWPSISLGYVSDVIVLVHRFITTAIRAIVPDELMAYSLFSILQDSLQYQYKRAVEQVDFLLQIELNGTPLTTNHYFNDNLEKSRQDRMIAAMQEFTFSDCSHGSVVKLTDAKRTHPMSNTEYIIQDIHDILHSYYKVARKRFADNVVKQAIDHFLLTGPQAPLKLFSPNFVSALSSDELNHIASEAPIVKRERGKLVKEISSLEAAKAILTRG